MKGYIYCIRSYQTEDIYIGSTINKLSRRMAGHRQQYKKHGNDKNKYVTSFAILKNGDAYIELIEEVEIEDKHALHKLEGQHIKNTINCINKLIAGRTDKEYVEDNHKKIKEYKKQYAEDNKDKIKEWQKKYREMNKEHIKKSSKMYRDSNKEYIKKKDREYYLKNAEKIKEKRRMYYEQQS